MPAELAAAAEALSGVLQRTLGWGVKLVTELGGEEEEEGEDDGPVVVEAPGEGYF